MSEIKRSEFCTCSHAIPKGHYQCGCILHDEESFREAVLARTCDGAVLPALVSLSSYGV